MTTAHLSIIADFLGDTNNEPRLFLGLRCGVPPRQTQTNNDASGNPQRVAGRPPFLFVRVTALHLTGQRLWASPTVSHTGDESERRPQAAGRSSQKKTASGLVRRGCPKPFWPVRCRPTEGAGRLPKRTAVAGQPAAIFSHSLSCIIGKSVGASTWEAR